MKFEVIIGIVLFCSSSFAMSETGFRSEDGWNRANLEKVTFSGQCPGRRDSSKEAFFSSETTRPDTGLRVRVTNVTEGFSGELPYTDRDYNRGVYSEHTYLKQATRHRGQTLSVMESTNDFRYRIYRASDNSTVEEGEFQIEVAVDEIFVERRPICEWRCERPTPEPICIPRQVCYCPF